MTRGISTRCSSESEVECIIFAIDYHRQCGGPKLRQRNHELATVAGVRLAADFATELAAPPNLFGSMITVRLPSERPAVFATTERLQIELETRFDVEASLVPLNGRPWLRASAAVYNEVDDLLAAGHAAARLLA